LREFDFFFFLTDFLKVFFLCQTLLKKEKKKKKNSILMQQVDRSEAQFYERASQAQKRLIPQPTSLSPTSGFIGQVVSITGSQFKRGKTVVQLANADFSVKNDHDLGDRLVVEIVEAIVVSPSLLSFMVPKVQDGRCKLEFLFFFHVPC
jgi:hypothetical protein